MMKSRRFLILAGLSFTTINLLGCARKTTSQPVSDRPAIESPKVTASAAQSQTAASPEATILRSGSFVAGEHPTQGTVRLIVQDNQRRLELDSAFSTSTSGPDLFVVFHRSADVIGSTTPPAYPIQEGDYVLLAPLQSYSGAQSYQIPDSLNLDDFQSLRVDSPPLGA